MLYLGILLADTRRVVGCHAVVRLGWRYDYSDEPQQVVLVVGMCSYRESVCESLEGNMKWFIPKMISNLRDEL